MITMAKRPILHVWIALLAILFSALAPTISHALATGRGDAAWSAMCGVSGIKPIPVVAVDADQKPVKDLQQHMQHCPYCATHGEGCALPAAAPSAFAVLGGHDLFPSLYYQAPAPLFSWAAAQPRGPPTIS